MKKTFSETITSQRPKGVTLVKQLLRLMEEILHHLAYIKPCKSWDIYHINWCRISSINSITVTVYFRMFWLQKGSRSRWDFSEDSIIQMIQDSKTGAGSVLHATRYQEGVYLILLLGTYREIPWSLWKVWELFKGWRSVTICHRLFSSTIDLFNSFLLISQWCFCWDLCFWKILASIWCCFLCCCFLCGKS